MRLTYTNSKDNQLILDSDSYKLQTWNGFGEAPAIIQTQKAPFQDGQTLIDELLEPRNITFQFQILGEIRQEVFESRREIQNIFNPKLGAGKLQWEQNDGTTFEIETVPDGSPQFPGGNAQSNTHQTVIVNLKAPGPAWKDIEESELTMATIVKLLEFPLELATQMSTRGAEREITNSGDLWTPVYIEFNGPITNPKIVNETTGEFIRVEQELLEGEKLMINTAFGKKTVIFEDSNGNQSNAFGYVDLDSTFWQLQVGNNIVSYTADSGTEQAVVELYYKQRYVGV